MMTVNAGAVSIGSLVAQDPLVGGGASSARACHLRRPAALSDRLADQRISRGLDRQGAGMRGGGQGHPSPSASRMAPSAPFAVWRTVRSLPERVEVFAGGRVLQLANYRKLTGFRWPGFSRMNLWRRDGPDGVRGRLRAERSSEAGRHRFRLPKPWRSPVWIEVRREASDDGAHGPAAFSGTRSPGVPRQDPGRICPAVNWPLVVLARAARDQRGGVRRRTTVLHALSGQGRICRSIRWRGYSAARLSW